MNTVAKRYSPRAAPQKAVDAVDARHDAEHEATLRLLNHRGLLSLYTAEELRDMKSIDSSVLIGHPEKIGAPIEDD